MTELYLAAQNSDLTEGRGRMVGIGLFDNEDEAVKAVRDKFYYDRIRYNPGAKMVKLADIHDNLQEWRLSYLPPDTQDRLRTKYADAVRMLNTNF